MSFRNANLAVANRGGTPDALRSAPDASFGIAWFTFVLWLGCVLVGVLGFVLPYARPHPPPLPETPVFAGPMPVDLSPEPLPPPEPEPPPPDLLSPPSAPDALMLPVITKPIAVTEPDSAIAFALPVEGPAQIVDFKNAEHARRPAVETNIQPAAIPAVTPLTFGEGEGRQPAPAYPRAAVRQGQEGTVIVRFAVNEEGDVTEAAVAAPSPWPALNEAALKTIRERWQFGRGLRRVYEVPIRFQLEK